MKNTIKCQSIFGFIFLGTSKNAFLMERKNTGISSKSVKLKEL